jgi:two-component system sensor histidine kinase DesK
MMKRLQDMLSPNGPWLYLLYLGMFFFRWVYQPPGLDEFLVSVAAMAGFIGAYVFAMRRMDWSVPLVAALATALGFAFVPVNMGGAVYVAFAAAMVARWPQPRWRTGFLVTLAVTALVTCYLMGLPGYFIAALFLFAGLAAGGAMMAAQRERADATADERQARAALLGAEAERQRIARDLHDLLGHTLSVVALKADLATRLYEDDPQRARTELGEIQRISREALTEVREAVTGLRGRDVQQAIIEGQARLEAAGLTVDVDMPAALNLTPVQAACMAMVVREAATNILRHADAANIEIELELTGNRLSLTVGDDGRGGADITGGGLQGLAARLDGLGGSLLVEPAAGGQGTRLLAQLVIEGPQHA